MRTVSSAASSVASGDAPEQVFYDALLRDSKFKAVEAPHFLPHAQVADTHAHLDMLHFPGLALARAAANKVSFIVSVIDPTEDPSYALGELSKWQQEAKELLAEWARKDKGDVASTLPASPTLPALQAPPTPPTLTPPEISIIMGCHPHNASAYTNLVEEQLLSALANDTRVVGIGEIGLDYHYDNSPRKVQQEVFRRQIQLAHQHSCTIALHLREAYADGIKILQEEGVPAKGVLLHCFNLDYATLEPFLELGCMVAFGGPLTFKKANEVREAAQKTPLSRLVTETDCPFMAPGPVRGSVCEPASVVFTAKMLAELREEPDALEQFYANAKGFFS